jgi:hypothetical protein
MRKPQGQEKYISHPTNQPALVAVKVGAVTPLAVVVTPLVWGKDYPLQPKRRN